MCHLSIVRSCICYQYQYQLFYQLFFLIALVNSTISINNLTNIGHPCLIPLFSWKNSDVCYSFHMYLSMSIDLMHSIKYCLKPCGDQEVLYLISPFSAMGNFTYQLIVSFTYFGVKVLTWALISCNVNP